MGKFADGTKWGPRTPPAWKQESDDSDRLSCQAAHGGNVQPSQALKKPQRHKGQAARKGSTAATLYPPPRPRAAVLVLDVANVPPGRIVPPGSR